MVMLHSSERHLDFTIKLSDELLIEVLSSDAKYSATKDLNEHLSAPCQSTHQN